MEIVQDDANVDPKAVEALLARELEQMSFEDREMMNEEIHGVRTLALDETPEMLEEGLRQLVIELETLPSTPCYDEAMGMSSPYVQDRSFKLKFLRAEMFDARKAAIRLEKYLSFHQLHFGTEALMRPIYLADLDKDDLEVLRMGNIQLLPSRDRSGRRILSRIGDMGGTIHSMRSKTRAILYLMQVLSDDEVTQRKGAVLIFASEPNKLGDYSPEKKQIVHSIYACQSIRWSAFHICLPSHPLFQALKGILLLAVGKELRAKARNHDGSPLEWQYSLSSYGINAEIIPITASGNIKTKTNNKWMTFRRAMEEAGRRSIPFDGIECPGVNDVFFRRGGNIANRHGNILLRELLEEKYELYKSRKTQEEKTRISWWVVEEVERRNGRFLIEGPQGWWVELQDRDIVREKVSNAFRDMRKIGFHSVAATVPQQQANGHHEIFGNFDSSKKRKRADCFSEIVKNSS